MKNADNGMLSGRQVFCLLALFLSGGVGTMGGGGSVRDIWLLMLLAGAAAVPLYLLYMYLAGAGQAPLGCFEAAFGRVAGGVMRRLLGLIALAAAAIELRIFTDFTAATALPRSPRFLIAALMAAALFLALRAGAEVLARAAAPAFWVVFGMLALSFAAALPQLDWGAVLPLGEAGPARLGRSFLSNAMIPFFEGFFALMVLAPLYNKKGGARRPVLGAALFAGLFLGLTLMKNIMLLGYPAGSQYYFPSYTAGSVTVISEFFQRQELLIAAPFLLCELVKAALCLLFAGQALGAQKHRWTGPALCAAALLLSLLGRGGVAETVEPLRLYGRSLFVPLLLLPLLTAAALRLRKKRRRR